MHVSPAPEPATFDKQVRQPGLQWLDAHPKSTASSKLPSLWTKCLPDMMREYRETCAYSCFRIHPVTGAATVDHVAPKVKSPALAYEWSNYRLVCARMNSRKHIFEDVPDPFEIDDAWFTLNLVTFDVEVSASVTSPDLRDRLQDGIDRLGLNNFSRQRESDAEDFWNREVSEKVLERESPFVARELRRQGKLRPRD